MIHIWHGEDELSRSERVKKLRDAMGDPQFADLNTTQFDGRKVTASELAHACEAVPFLADKRLVIVEGLLARCNPRQDKKDADGETPEQEVNPDLAQDIIALLDRVPDTTVLVFVEAKTLAKNNPVFKHAASIKDKKKISVEEFVAPDIKVLPKWIIDRVKAKGGTIEGAAVAELAAHIGNDLRLLDSEIEKMLVYRANAPIRAQDVQTLVASVRESNIFAMVDAIGLRQRQTALKLLHDQLAHRAEPLALFGMITRQFRLLLQAKDCHTRGMTSSTAAAMLKVNSFVMQKAFEQAHGFSLPQLEAIYQKLLDTDIALKTSRLEPVVALDLLVAELTK